MKHLLVLDWSHVRAHFACKLVVHAWRLTRVAAVAGVSCVLATDLFCCAFGLHGDPCDSEHMDRWLASPRSRGARSTS